jgi:hypothetical protein
MMNLFSRFFGPDIKSLFLNFSPKESTWRAVSWNYDIKGRLIETHGVHRKSIQWMSGGTEAVAFFKDDELVRRKKITQDDFNLKVMMNLAIHSTLKISLEDYKTFMTEPVSGATAMDVQNEARSLQWIQASLGTLMRAMDRFASDSSLVLTAAFFAGTEPQTNDRVLRLLAFNLDIFLYLKEDHSLQLVVFDDKNLGQGNAKTPTFNQIIKVTKPQFYDEIIKVVHRLAVVGELK